MEEPIDQIGDLIIGIRADNLRAVEMADGTWAKQTESLLSLAHLSLDEDYFVSSFISGLDDLIQPTVKMFQHQLDKQQSKPAFTNYHWKPSLKGISYPLRVVERRLASMG